MKEIKYVCKYIYVCMNETKEPGNKEPTKNTYFFLYPRKLPNPYPMTLPTTPN